MQEGQDEVSRKHSRFMSQLNPKMWLASLLAVLLMTVTIADLAAAAEEQVTGIEFQYDDANYNNSTSSLEMFVEDNKVHVSVLASIAGSTSKKDVTADAVWKSTNTSYVKVDKGILTGVGKGTATISAVYKGYTISIKASSDYMYDSVKLMDKDEAAPAKIQVELGQSLRYTLNGTKNGVTEDVTSEAIWTTSNSSVATVDEGEIKLTGTGTATITAKLKGKSASIALTVSSPYKSIVIAPNQLLELEVGADDTALAATAYPKTGGSLNATDKAVWTTGNAKVVKVEKGLVTPVGAGKTTITVSHMGVSASIDVVVRTPYQSIRLTPEKEFHMLLQDSPLNIRAEVLSNSNVSYDATLLADWTSSNVVVATVSNGVVVPKEIGTTKITASYKGVSRSIDVQVYPSINKLTIENKTIDGFGGTSGELPTVMGTTFDGTKVDVSKLVKWHSSNNTVAEIKDGKWKANEIGETALIATLGHMSAETKLIVHVKPLKLIPESKELSIIIGKEISYPAVTVINVDGEEEDVSKSIKWESNSDNIVLKEKTIKGLDQSTVTLTGTYLNKSVSVKVKIEEEIVKIVAEPTELLLNPNKSKSIKVTGYYKSGKSVVLSSKIDWTVANPALAAVNGRTVKALNPGTTVVTGSYQGVKISIPVKITPKIKSLTASDKSLKLTKGASGSVEITANYTTGEPVIVTDAAVWTTSKASVATVKNGKIQAVAKGTATISASFEGKTVTIRVTVK